MKRLIYKTQLQETKATPSPDPEPQEVEVLGFDYDTLPKRDIAFARKTTAEIGKLLERSIGDIIEVGNKLIEMKERLGHGYWRDWLRSEWPLDPSLANRWMNVARKVGQFPHLQIPRSTLYTLAADSTPDDLRQDYLERVENGEPPMPLSELKAQIRRRSSAKRPPQDSDTRSVRDQILEYIDTATDRIAGANPEAYEALLAARKLVERLNK